MVINRTRSISLKNVAKFHSRRKQKQKITIMNKKVAVYGTLLRGECREGALKNCALLGKFQTEPKFDMFSNGSFPFIIEGGNTSVEMEVYDLDSQNTLDVLDSIEGVSTGLYDRETIVTPYGEAYVYVQKVNNDSRAVQIQSGSWKEFTKKI